MQVPEKLSLIGGSILLASTLVFTLKSQASQILPKVNNGMSEMFKSDQERQQAQQGQAFDNNFQQAQQKGWQTGQWGSAKFYVDDQNTMHVGSGQLNGPVFNQVDYNKIKTINLDTPIQAPQNSSFLFAMTNYNSPLLTQINGLSNLDTSRATNIEEMFGNDKSLSSLDLSHFDTHNVTSMFGMFNDDNVHQLTLGPNTNFQNNPNNSNYDTYLSGTYQSNGQTLNLVDGNAHPGTWIRQ